MKLATLVFSALALSTSLSVATAADVDYAPAFDWTGGYIGLHAGFGGGDVDYFSDLTGENVSPAPDGVLGGAQAGYNFQAGDIVFGPEVSFSLANIGGGDARSLTSPTVSYGGGVDWLGVVGGRIGYAADRFYMFGHGGYAFGEIETNGVAGFLSDSFSTNKTHGGFAVGVGAEYAMTDNVLLGVKYSYVDLGNKSHSGTTALGSAFTNRGVDAELHVVNATLNFKF